MTASLDVRRDVLQMPLNETVLTRLDRIYGAMHNPSFAVQPTVCQEAADLYVQHGVDVDIIQVDDPYALPREAQSEVDGWVAAYEDSPVPAGAESFASHPAMSVWTKLRMRAHALQPLYTPLEDKLGGPIDETAYDRPLFRQAVDRGDGVTEIVMRTAREVVIAEHEAAGRVEKGGKLVADHVEFVRTEIDSTSRLLFMGTKDAEAIRARALIARQMAVEHFAGADGTIDRDDLKCASFACGAAGPVSLLMADMRGRGADFEKVYILDKDPLALAGAHQILEKSGIGDDVVDVMLTDLLHDDFSQKIENGSLDIADLLGIVEYLPDEYAVALLAKVKGLMAPGAVVLWGNMLKDRPQQKMFKDVVRWPRLQQRTIEHSLRLAVEAGYELSDIRVRVSAEDGVYANFAMRVPDIETESTFRPTTTTAADLALRNAA